MRYVVSYTDRFIQRGPQQFNSSVSFTPLENQCGTQCRRTCRTYTSSSISYITLEIDEQSNCFQGIHEKIAIKAFQRLVMSISGEKFKERFNVAERLVPMLYSQGLEAVKQHFQESEFRYLAYREPIFAVSDVVDSEQL